MGYVRYPRGTAYQGPHANYDRLVSPEANLSRIVYGLPRPMLRPRQHRDDAFYGRLFDELTNSHAVLVKICNTKSSAYCFAKRLRPELHSELYSVGVKQNEDDPQDDEWLVIVYNRVTAALREPAWMRRPEARPDWLGSREAARILGVTPSHAARLMARVHHVRVGGRNEIMVHRNDLLVLANRHRRWRHRTKKADDIDKRTEDVYCGRRGPAIRT